MDWVAAAHGIVRVMQTWSYRFEVIDGDEEDGVLSLDQWGAQGWECFSVEVRVTGVASRSLRCWLKRAGRPADPSYVEIG